MTLDVKPHELFEHNSRLQDMNEELDRKNKRIDRHPSVLQRMTGNRCPAFVDGPCVKFALICVLIVTAIIVYSSIQLKQESTLDSLASSEKLTGDDNSEYGLQIHMDQQPSYQDCRGSQLKQSFPDLDYALLGYNIMRGFPLAVGHDPGFTYPIFKADYSGGKQTADCRYAIPKGLVVIPDVSCVTSFSSTTIRTKYEFSNALSIFTRVSVKAWKYKFSASTGYKTASSQMSSSKYVFILSTAECNYYFSKLVSENAPRFDDVFIKWVRRLNGQSDKELYFNFFETYGTHFATEVTFGARYTNEYKMTSTYYESQREKHVNVRAAASASGLFGSFKAKAEFQLSSSQKKSMEQFRENVEVKTTTVGAPPPENGGADAWASEVKTNPVPSEYKLSSIENLFTSQYMSSLGVNYNGIYKKIVSYKVEYCLYLQRKGEVDSCEDLVAGIELSNTRLLGQYKEEAVASVSECIEVCLDDMSCAAVSFCTTCSAQNHEYKTCHLLSEHGGRILTSIKTVDENAEWQSNVFPGKLDSKLVFNSTSIIGVPRGFEKEGDKNADRKKCEQLCVDDAYCAVYSFNKASGTTSRCKMYGKEQINRLEPQANTDTIFISSQ